jgi:lipopolysaccharide assembly protein A
MQAVRTICWIALTAVVVTFVAVNWGDPYPVRIVPHGDGWLLVDWPVGFIALVFFLAGFVPMWLYHRAAKWQAQRRITTLQAAARPAYVAPPPPPLASPDPLTPSDNKAPQE